MSILFVIILLSSISTFAQVRTEEWVRIEAGKNELSFAVPKDFVVYERSGPGFEDTSISAYSNGVIFEIGLREQANFPGLFAPASEEENKPTILEFKLKGFSGRSLIRTKDGYQNVIQLQSGSKLYTLKVHSKSKDDPITIYFLQSIAVKGEALFQSSNDYGQLFVVRAKDLETSPRVAEAIKRKDAKVDRKISFEPSIAFRSLPTDFSRRPAVLISPFSPEFSFSAIRGAKGGPINMVFEIRTDGQVGDITVYSDVDRSITRSWAEAAGRLKFLPAEKNGAAESSRYVWISAFGVTTSTRIFTVQ